MGELIIVPRNYVKEIQSYPISVNVNNSYALMVQNIEPHNGITPYVNIRPSEINHYSEPVMKYQHYMHDPVLDYASWHLSSLSHSITLSENTIEAKCWVKKEIGDFIKKECEDVVLLQVKDDSSAFSSYPQGNKTSTLLVFELESDLKKFQTWFENKAVQTITIQLPQHQNTDTFWKDVHEWCDFHITGQYRVTGYSSRTYKFKEEHDFILFQMKWS